MIIKNLNFKKLSNFVFDNNPNSRFNGFLPFCLQIKGLNSKNDPNIICQSNISHSDFFSDYTSDHINSSLRFHSIDEKFDFDSLPKETIFELYQFDKNLNIYHLNEIIFENKEQFSNTIYNIYKNIEQNYINDFFKNKEFFKLYFAGIFDAFFYMNIDNVISNTENFIGNNFKLEFESISDKYNLFINQIFNSQFDFKFQNQIDYFEFAIILNFFFRQGIIENYTSVFNNNLSLNSQPSFNLEPFMLNFKEKVFG